MIPTILSFAIEWFSFASNLHDQTTIFELKINTFIHANIIKEKKIVNYSRVHKSSDSFFSKILEKPSIVKKKMIPHIKGLDFSMR